MLHFASFVRKISDRYCIEERLDIKRRNVTTNKNHLHANQQKEKVNNRTEYTKPNPSIPVFSPPFTTFFFLAFSPTSYNLFSVDKREEKGRKGRKLAVKGDYIFKGRQEDRRKN